MNENDNNIYIRNESTYFKLKDESNMDNINLFKNI